MGTRDAYAVHPYVPALQINTLSGFKLQGKVVFVGFFYSCFVVIVVLRWGIL